MEFGFRCSACDRSFGLDAPLFRCGCGGLLDVAPFPARFSAAEVLAGERSLFRYAAALPFARGAAPWREVSMGEGLTPLVRLDPRDPRVLVKVDYAMPTLSFKDRGAVVLVAQAKALGVRKILQDSSGNAGAAVAAYAARARIPCRILVPEATSPSKIAQIAAYGAEVKVVPGNREDTAAAAMDEAAGGAFYASHVYNPLFHQGTKTYVFELYEALGGMPGTLFVPVGNGTLLLGVHHGLQDLKALGLIDRFPRVVAVQAEGCAPIHRAFIDGAVAVEPVRNEGTAAEGIAIAAPIRGGQILAALRALGGEVVVAPESVLPEAKRALADHGFFVETTTAATYAAFLAAGADAFSGPVVLPLCGAGLKSL